MGTIKVTFLSISVFIVLFLLFAALFDLWRCIMDPQAYYYSITSNHMQGSTLWYWDLFKPNAIILLFCFLKLYIIKKYAEAGERQSIWNTVFYFAFTVLIIVGALAIIEIFDTPDIEIIQNA